jgi:hypothetical protein
MMMWTEIHANCKGITEGSGRSTYNPTIRQQNLKRYENNARSSFIIEDIGPMWLREEIKRQFPKTTNPGKFPGK